MGISFYMHMPTQIFFGRGEIKKLKQMILPLEKKIMVVTDKGIRESSNSLNLVLSLLAGKDTIVYSDVEENPSIETVEKGAALAKEKGVEVVIGLGGGSPMDAAKGIAILAFSHTGLRDHLNGSPLKNNPLKLVCIPTTSGTGSEVTPYAVFTDSQIQNKRGFSHPALFPQASIIDPEVTFSMPRGVIINTALDAMTHAMEAFLSTLSFPLNDQLALHAIDAVIAHIDKAADKDEEAMANLAYAAMIGGINITNAGTILLHIMGYPLSMFHQIPHGRANAILLPNFLAYMKDHAGNKDKISFLLKKFDDRGGPKAFIESLGISTKLADYGITQKEIEIYAQKTIVKDDVHITPVPIRLENIIQIYQM